MLKKYVLRVALWWLRLPLFLLVCNSCSLPWFSTFGTMFVLLLVYMEQSVSINSKFIWSPVWPSSKIRGLSDRKYTFFCCLLSLFFRMICMQWDIFFAFPCYPKWFVLAIMVLLPLLSLPGVVLPQTYFGYMGWPRTCQPFHMEGWVILPNECFSIYCLGHIFWIYPAYNPKNHIRLGSFSFILRARIVSLGLVPSLGPRPLILDWGILPSLLLLGCSFWTGFTDHPFGNLP